MEQERLIQAMQIFGVPEEFYDVAPLMVQEVEWEMILAMGKKSWPQSELEAMVEEKKLAAGAPDFIWECYHRSIIDKVLGENEGVGAFLAGKEQPPEGERSYQISDFYSRYPFYAMFEYYAYGKLPRETKKRLNDWDLGVYMEVNREIIEAKKRGEERPLHNSDFITLEEAYAFVDRHQEAICRYPCNCKTMMYYHNRPQNVCLHFYCGPNSTLDRGHGTKITAEEAKALLKECNEKGLMQSGEDVAICNCDSYACYPIQMGKAMDTKGIYPRSKYDIVFHPEKCDNCGECLKICNFAAFSKDENGKITHDMEKCWGCTICAPNCPQKAIELVAKG